jgi:predicted PurR-regulated permease PerM
MDSFGAGLLAALWIFAIVLAIACIVLPLAMIGTKPILRDLVAEQKKTNEWLRQLNDKQHAMVRQQPGLVSRPSAEANWRKNLISWANGQAGYFEPPPSRLEPDHSSH